MESRQWPKECLKPTHLNKAIRWDHHRTPTLEEITHELAGSTKFTKVDGSSSYYCIILKYEPSLLTTFNTHRGRFCFVHLPFRLTCAQDIFQRVMDQILDHCEGAIRITDNIIIHGKYDAEHDRRLHKLMKVTREHGLVLKKKKCEVKSNSAKLLLTTTQRYLLYGRCLHHNVTVLRQSQYIEGAVCRTWDTWRDSRNPRSNGQAESAVKTVKGLLTHAKCSGQDPYLTLLVYRSTPVDSHLWSPAKMLYQHALCTTVPQRIRQRTHMQQLHVKG